ncbi:ubiquinol-cytochrome C reductase [Lipomyces oligophaga]|uniref:ubiquinol-cytochrome C reductase n=1 Tax=Lipomyces oligophaga TaxID=45792 RepID=UPI0034CDEDE7
MAISTTIYNIFFRRNSIMVGSAFAGAFAFEMAFDTVTNKYWEAHNQGKLWKDIKYKYVTKDEDEE